MYLDKANVTVTTKWEADFLDVFYNLDDEIYKQGAQLFASKLMKKSPYILKWSVNSAITFIGSIELLLKQPYTDIYKDAFNTMLTREVDPIEQLHHVLRHLAKNLELSFEFVESLNRQIKFYKLVEELLEIDEETEGITVKKEGNWTFLS